MSSLAKPCTRLMRTGCCGRFRNSARWWVYDEAGGAEGGLGSVALKWSFLPQEASYVQFIKTVVDKILTRVHIIDFNYSDWGRKYCHDAWGAPPFPKILISGWFIAFSIGKGTAKHSLLSAYNCNQNFSNGSALEDNVWRYISTKLRPSYFRTITQDKFRCVPPATWRPYFIFMD